LPVGAEDVVSKKTKNKCRGHQPKGVSLHPDNARPHTTAQTVQTMNNLGWELLSHVWSLEYERHKVWIGDYVEKKKKLLSELIISPCTEKLTLLIE